MTPNSKYNRRSIRLKGYDYSQPGAYFITICTYQKICLFGDIFAGEVHLNPFGMIASRELARLPQRFPNMTIDEAIIMPNHIHAIWIIRKERGTAEREIDTDPSSISRARTEQFGKPVSGSIPTIVRSYKSSVAMRIHRMRGVPSGPIWQRNYYEHIIRNDAEWGKIQAYIKANPSRWDNDEYRIES